MWNGIMELMASFLSYEEINTCPYSWLFEARYKYLNSHSTQIKLKLFSELFIMCGNVNYQFLLSDFIQYDVRSCLDFSKF